MGELIIECDRYDFKLREVPTVWVDSSDFSRQGAKTPRKIGNRHAPTPQLIVLSFASWRLGVRFFLTNRVFGRKAETRGHETDEILFRCWQRSRTRSQPFEIESSHGQAGVTRGPFACVSGATALVEAQDRAIG